MKPGDRTPQPPVTRPEPPSEPPGRADEKVRRPRGEWPQRGTGGRVDRQIRRVTTMVWAVSAIGVGAMLVTFVLLPLVNTLPHSLDQSDALHEELSVSTQQQFDAIVDVAGPDSGGTQGDAYDDYVTAQTAADVAAAELLSDRHLDAVLVSLLLDQERFRSLWEAQVAEPILAGVGDASTVRSQDSLLRAQWAAADAKASSQLQAMLRLRDSSWATSVVLAVGLGAALLSTFILAMLGGLRERIAGLWWGLEQTYAHVRPLLLSVGQATSETGDAAEDLATAVTSFERIERHLTEGMLRENVVRDMGRILSEQVEEHQAALAAARHLGDDEAVGADRVLIWSVDTAPARLLAQHQRPDLDPLEDLDPPDLTRAISASSALVGRFLPLSDAELETYPSLAVPGTDVHSWLVLLMWDGWELVGCIMFGRLAEAPFTPVQREIARDGARDLTSVILRTRRAAMQAQVLKGLKEVTAARELFMSTVSHELRTPLSSIIGYTELLAEGDLGPLTDQQTRALEVIDRNGRTLSELIEDILTISRIQGRGIEPVLEPVVLEDAVTAVIEDLRPTAEKADLTVSCSGPGSTTVMVDPMELRRIVENVLTNALRYTPGGGRVSVEVRRDDGTATLAVVDTGMGIPEEEQGRLFEPFYRATNARAMPVKGTGLGLSTIKALVEHYGGQIAVRSTLGVGTTVEIQLPCGGHEVLPGPEPDQSGEVQAV